MLGWNVRQDGCAETSLLDGIDILGESFRILWMELGNGSISNTTQQYKRKQFRLISSRHVGTDGIYNNNW
jgi:hypothetical protein